MHSTLHSGQGYSHFYTIPTAYLDHTTRYQVWKLRGSIEGELVQGLAAPWEHLPAAGGPQRSLTSNDGRIMLGLSHIADLPALAHRWSSTGHQTFKSCCTNPRSLIVSCVACSVLTPKARPKSKLTYYDACSWSGHTLSLQGWLDSSLLGGQWHLGVNREGVLCHSWIDRGYTSRHWHPALVLSSACV